MFSINRLWRSANALRLTGKRSERKRNKCTIDKSKSMLTSERYYACPESCTCRCTQLLALTESVQSDQREQTGRRDPEACGAKPGRAKDRVRPAGGVRQHRAAGRDAGGGGHSAGGDTE